MSAPTFPIRARIAWPLLAVAVGLAGGLGAGCAGRPVYQDYAAFVREPLPAADPSAYRLAISDVVIVTQRRGERVVESRHTLAGNGQLWVDGLGVVPAADRSVAEVTADLEARARRLIDDRPRPDSGAAMASLDTDGTHPAPVAEVIDAPEALEVEGPLVGLRVQTYAGRKLFVFGQVDHSGAHPFTAADRVLETVASAGPNARADVRNVLVLRPHADGSLRRRLTVDLQAMIQAGDTTLNVLLQEGDVVYVPPTRLGSAGLLWDQLFGQRKSPAPVATAEVSPSRQTTPHHVQPGTPDMSVTPGTLGTPSTPARDTLDLETRPLTPDAMPPDIETATTQPAVAAAQAGLGDAPAVSRNLGADHADDPTRGLQAAVEALAREMHSLREAQGRSQVQPGLPTVDPSIPLATAAPREPDAVLWRDPPAAAVPYPPAVGLTQTVGHSTPRPFRSHPQPTPNETPGATPPGSATSPVAEPTRGGAGEGVTPQGVRFWGPG